MPPPPASPTSTATPRMYNVIYNLRKNADYIKSLTLSAHHVGLNFGDLIDALYTNTTLQQVYCHARFLDFMTAQQVKELLQALASLPQLQVLSISFPTHRAHLSSLVVDHCVTSCPWLRQLTITGVNGKACRALAKCLVHHASLCHVELELVNDQVNNNNDDDEDDHDAYRGEASGVHAMAMALSQPTCRLQKLVLVVVPSANLSHDKDNDNDNVVAMASALAKNTTLQHLDMDLASSSSGCRRGTTKTSRLSLQPAKVNYQPLLHVLETKQNTTLQSLKLNTNTHAVPDQVQAALDFYTRLNALGVVHWMTQKTQSVTCTSSSSKQWCHVIINMISATSRNRNHHDNKDKDDLSVIFYILTQDPTLLLLYSPPAHIDKKQQQQQAHHHRQQEQSPWQQRANETPCSLPLPWLAASSSSLDRNNYNNNKDWRRQKAVHAPRCWALNVPC